MSSITFEASLPPLYYTDSTVVLTWLRTPLYRLKVFEANRVSAILKASQVDQWRFVRSEVNPADIASRGCLPTDLLGSDFWFYGPPWLREETLPLFRLCGQNQEANESGMSLLSRAAPEIYDDAWMARFSSFQRLMRVTALILRLADHARSRSSPLTGPISAKEYSRALLACVRLVQRTSLPPDLHSSSVPREYRQLNPFVDEVGLVRVGGRIRNSEAPQDQKHPLLLPHDHQITRLVIDDIHLKHFHAGPTLTLSLLRSRFWVPRALKVIKSRTY
ncbi:uncharacterized protein [Halyomorpha halys]|uniref:uncharacterized protein n=1 Tax=Halyomorpha halys TaxID=286706 RepID=UPI0006D4F2D9